jgi:hypothetical protein
MSNQLLLDTAQQHARPPAVVALHRSSAQQLMRWHNPAAPAVALLADTCLLAEAPPTAA